MNLQRFFTAVLPKKWAQSMEAESRRWMVRCPCGFERSVWESGGVRWKARGTDHQYARCPHCGTFAWHTIYLPPRRSAAAPAAAASEH